MTALLAVGGVMMAVDAVMQGELDNAFCAVRPPGHHAERDRAMGFCFFNKSPWGRYMPWSITAWSGWPSSTGTCTTATASDICSSPTPGSFTSQCMRSAILLSRHRLCPGRGPGAGPGLHPEPALPTPSGGEEYLEAINEQAMPRLRQFAPQFVMISAGFDAHAKDPLAHINLTRSTYWEMTRLLLTWPGKAPEAG